MNDTVNSKTRLPHLDVKLFVFFLRFVFVESAGCAIAAGLRGKLFGLAVDTPTSPTVVADEVGAKVFGVAKHDQKSAFET